MKKTILRLALCCLGTCSSFTVLADSVYQIHPIPHQQQAVGGTTKIPAGKIQVICGDHIDSYTKARLKNILSEHNLISDSDEIFATAPSEGFVHIFVGVNNSGDKADAKATALKLSRDVFTLQNKYDKHLLSLQDAGGLAEIVILGENTDAAFIGMASLEQILDYNAPESIPCGIIYDYADQKNRGLVEGYYGVPYSIDVKKDVMRFMMRHKMNSYMYGAKSDYYHSAYWKQPYPATITEQQKNLGYLSQDMVRDLTQVSHETKVNFIWAIHPGNDFLNSSTVITDIMNKYKRMYALGVRQFAVFVDDVAIPSTQAQYDLNAARFGNADDLRRRNPSESIRDLAGKLRVRRRSNDLEQLRVRNNRHLDHPAEFLPGQPSGSIQIFKNCIQDGVAFQYLGIGRRKTFCGLKVAVVDRSCLLCVIRAVVYIEADL